MIFQIFCFVSELKTEPLRVTTKRVGHQQQKPQNQGDESSLIKVSRKMWPSPLASDTSNSKSKHQPAQPDSLSGEYLNVGSTSSSRSNDDDDEDDGVDVYEDTDTDSSDYANGAGAGKPLDKRRHYLIESEHLHLQKGKIDHSFFCYTQTHMDRLVNSISRPFLAEASTSGSNTQLAHISWQMLASISSFLASIVLLMCR